MTNPMTKIEVTENGAEVVPMTQAEIDQWNADNLAAKQRKDADVLALSV